jgi:glycosyltransferase involved in cell wall biosynthesis
MTDISVVSGTYNRLASLQRMVQSARDSVQGVLGISLDFVLVDGGSRDGTLQWCREQPDVTLIEQGTLMGAVRAFNAGAFAAEADYVILANDDVEFVDDSILKAFIYMQSDKECGIGCFYQNRNGRDWHVEEMPCVDNGKQVHRPYGQVCIVPKWLGDYAGWWGDYLHTYGGDNELSSKVYELGFKVSPIPGAKISDHEVQDDLRKINNAGQMTDPRKTAGHHPDSWAWGRRWKHLDLPGLPVGPIIRHYPMLENPITSKHRIVYLPIYEQGWAVQKQQKRGLREALAKVALTVEYDYIERFTAIGKDGMLAELGRLMRQIQPTLFLSQLHNGAQINHEDIFALRQNWPDTKFVNWNGDYWPDNLLSEDGIKLAKSFDWQLTVNRDADEKYQAMGVNSRYWQIGFEPDGIGYEGDYNFDVVFLASGYSQARKELVSRLRSCNFNFGLFGPGWKDAKGQTIYNFIEGCKIYRGAKISIGDSQWPDTGFVSNRVFQALAAGGSALAHQWFRGMESLGLEDGKTCIIWRDFSELQKKIEYYLSHEPERKAIALAGEKLALERHSFDNRVSELLELIDDKVEESWR